MRIRAVTLDLDETMLDRHTTFERFVRGQMLRFPTLFEEVDGNAYFGRVIELDRDDSAPKVEVFRAAAREHALSADAGTVLAEDFVRTFPDECVVFPGLFETLTRLKGMGCRLGVITNGGSVLQRRKIERMDIAGVMDHITVSGEMGCSKPDPIIFTRTLERLGVEPEEAVHVGDNPRTDIAGAKAAGLGAVWVGSRHWREAPGADIQIDGIAELPRALSKLRE